MTQPEETEETEVEGAEQLGDAGKKALDAMKAKLKAERAAAAELKAKAAKFDELDALSKSDLEREAEARTKAEKERDDARIELLRLRVATAKGLPADLAARLQGHTEDELNRDAEALLKLFRAAEQPQSSSRPVPALRSGALPASDPQTLQPDDYIRAMARKGTTR